MKIQKDKVSVIMSVFNAEKTLSDCIQSILYQTYSNFEFLIVDDSSTDGTYDLLESFQLKDNRIRIFQNDINIGLTKSLNLVSSFATGEYLARQDADDISLVTRFERQIKVMTNKNIDSCNTRAITRNSHLITPSKSYYLPFWISMKYKNPFIHGSLMIRRTVFEEINRYDENFYYAQDYKLMDSLINNNYSPFILKEPLYILNQTNNISTNNKEEQKYYARCVTSNQTPNTRK